MINDDLFLLEGPVLSGTDYPPEFLWSVDDDPLWAIDALAEQKVQRSPRIKSGYFERAP